MGIKGIYGEIGTGERVALAKLAIENLERAGRPLRIAVDISIWQFQIQSGKGGSNPALRTLYYRLIRLLSLSIQPLFVFDGSQKPPFKRNKRTGSSISSLTDFNTKQLLKLFGFPFHIAPGEAEAECALLQREGIVDAVLSEDVDTLMFGCTLTLRNWSSEGSRGNRAPTHVSLYKAKATKEGKSGLDREGMILVALMSGGDYITEGVPGCGIKVACEAARAGFGRSLCMLPKTDTTGLNKWREELIHELCTNESKHFRVKHKALRIPDTFPNKEALGYYTHPVVSSATKLIKMKESIEWDSSLDVAGLRLFVAEAFGWTCKTGAKKFIRGLAPALLVSKLRARADQRASAFDYVVYTAMNEMGLVREICMKRDRSSTDGITELRLVYHPANIMGLDLDAEADESDDYGRDGLAPVGEDDNPQAFRSEDESDGTSKAISRDPTKRTASSYDPTEFQKVWVPETIAKLGIPLMVEDYEEALRNPKRPQKSKAAPKKGATSNGGMPKGSLDRYVTIIKPTVDSQNHQSPKKPHSVLQGLQPTCQAPASDLPSPFCSLAPSEDFQSQDLYSKKVVSKRRAAPLSITKGPKPKAAPQKKGLIAENPWMIAQISSPASQSPSSLIRISKPGIARLQSSKSHQPMKDIEKTSSIAQDTVKSPPSSPSFYRKHYRQNNYTSDIECSQNPRKDFLLIPTFKKRIISSIASSEGPATLAKQAEKVMQQIIDIPPSPSPVSEPTPATMDKSTISAIFIVRQLLQGENSIQEKGGGKKWVVSRESLEGSWKEVGEEPTSERMRGGAWRASAVEILDMTSDQ